jgi:TM2 domain-containing membrane protein YozV
MSETVSPSSTPAPSQPAAPAPAAPAAPAPAPAAPAAPLVPISNTHPRHDTLKPEPVIPCPTPPKIPRTQGVYYEDFKVHYSDICTYINPDRDFETAKMLSTWGGLLALDHFYLRSPTTAFAKIAVNCLTFGLWWIWDANQFWFEKEHVLNYGLNYLLDYERGIGRGVMTDTKPEFVPKKDFMTFMLLAIFFGMFGLDRMYLGGDFIFQGWAKFLSCFILIGLIWVFFDWYQVLFQPGTVLADGYLVPLPFTAMYEDWDFPKASYVGDLFQVTLTRQEKGILADKEKAEAGPSMMSLATGAAGAAKLPGLGKLTSLAGKLPGPAGMAARLAAKAAGLPKQRGGGLDEGEGGSVTQAAFAAVILGLSSIGGYSLFKSLKT